ncbi:MAG: molybdenum cofactor biosynthesis protein MoaE [Bdellovibrionales bacterium]|nr:molybdenum cofactor biosynthesis protein MoaE [Bdellovibrionales bacterium]
MNASLNRIEIEVSDSPIGADSICLQEFIRPDCGACDLFFGTVRGRNHGKDVVAVSYDAFVPLARAELRRIGEEALGAANTQGTVVIRHRTGKLAVGELSVLIAVFTPHRAQAFEACRFVIEELKKRAPIWKKEFYRDGETEWLKGHSLCGGL